MEINNTTGLSDAEIAAETRAIAKIKAVPNPPVDGAHVKFCGVDAVVPPLKVKHLRKYADQLEKLRTFALDTPLVEFMEVAVPVLHAALTRNYPSLTVEDVEELVDIATINDAILGVMGQSGYRAAKPGE